MKKIYFIVFSFLIISSVTFAQQNFKPGYIVNLKGDTIKGQVDYREWDKNPTDIKFRLPAGTTTEAYNISNMLAFGVNGFETYQAFTVEVTQGSVSLADVSFVDTAKLTEHVFLKLLVNGDKVNLYSYTDKIKSRFYFSETGNAPMELGYAIANENGITYRRVYRNQLVYLAQKYKPNATGITRFIERAEYEESTLTNIVKQINNAVTEKITANKGKAVDVFVGAGAYYGVVKFDGNVALAANASNAVTPYPYFNIGLTCFANPGTRKLYVMIDATVKASSQKTTVTNNVSTSFLTETDVLDYKQYTGTLAIQAGYNFYNTDAFKVFANIGLGINVSSYKTTYSQSYAASTYVATASDFPKFEGFYLNPLVKAGVTLKRRLSIFATYNVASGNTTYLYFSGKVSGYQLGANFVIGK